MVPVNLAHRMFIFEQQGIFENKVHIFTFTQMVLYGISQYAPQPSETQALRNNECNGKEYKRTDFITYHAQFNWRSSINIQNNTKKKKQYTHPL